MACVHRNGALERSVTLPLRTHQAFTFDCGFNRVNATHWPIESQSKAAIRGRHFLADAAYHDRAEAGISVGGVVELCRLVLFHMKSLQE
jgi:hypothetical protein